MDSNLRKTAILVSVSAVLLISVLVIYANVSSGRNGRSDNSVNNTAAPQAASGSGEDGEIMPSPGQIGENLSAFLEDNTFFDPEEDPVLEAAKDAASRLSLVVTSVEKDLRIQIVNAAGEPVAGQSFLVKLSDMGEYKDLDQDGVIYIGNLSAGEYSVELLPVDGYRVPNNATRVRVKDKVEYIAISDISLLIKTEDEIDADEDDTAVSDAQVDADPSGAGRSTGAE